MQDCNRLDLQIRVCERVAHPKLEMHFGNNTASQDAQISIRSSFPSIRETAIRLTDSDVQKWRNTPNLTAEDGGALWEMMLA